MRENYLLCHGAEAAGKNRKVRLFVLWVSEAPCMPLHDQLVLCTFVIAPTGTCGDRCSSSMDGGKKDLTLHAVYRNNSDARCSIGESGVCIGLYVMSKCP